MGAFQSMGESPHKTKIEGVRGKVNAIPFREGYRE